MRLKSTIHLLLLLLLAGLAMPQAQEPLQEPHRDEEDAGYSFFAGTVEEFSEDEITVRRTLVSRSPDVRHFIRNVETKVTGTLEKGVRVVVAYTTEDNYDIAWRVLVRPKEKDPAQQDDPV